MGGLAQTQDKHALWNPPTDQWTGDTAMEIEKMDHNNKVGLAKESSTTKASGEDKQPSTNNLDPMDKETQQETTPMNKQPPEQCTTPVNTEQETSKEEANQDTQVQEGS